jgi:hypothetical protein
MTDALNDLSNLVAVNHQFDSDAFFSPVGNGASTSTRFNMLLNDKYTNQREFEFALGGNFTHGTPTDSSDFAAGAKVLQYLGVYASGTVNRVWAQNALLHLAEGTNIRYANVHELDIDNCTKSYGTADAGSGLGPYAVWGVTINGAHSCSSSTPVYTITGGIGLLSSQSGPLYERGFVDGPGATRQAGFDCYSGATFALRDTGSHSVGIELRGSYSTAAVRIPQGVSISSLNPSGDTVRMLNVDSQYNLRLGAPSGMTNLLAERTLLPATDNTFQLGSAQQRWTSVWAANGTIQTSDARLKTEVEDISSEQAARFIDALEPKSFKWRVGGQEAVVEKQKREILLRHEDQVIEMQSSDGSMVEHTLNVPIFEEQDVDVVVGYKSVPGKRRHFGVVAGNVKAACDAAGIADFGGYVRDEDGTEAVRPDQLLAMALVELRSLRQRMATLELAA